MTTWAPVSESASPGSGPGAPAPSLRDYLRILARRKLLVIVVLLLVPAVALVITLREQPLYQGSAEVLLRNLNLATGLTGIPDSSAVNPERIAETQAGLARVPAVAERTLRAAGLRDRTADDFLKASSVTTKTNSDLITFTVRDPEQGLATRLASAYAREYTKYRRELDTAALQKARLDLENRIAALKASNGSRGSLYASLVANAEKLRTMEALLSSNASVVRTDETAVQVSPQPVRTGIFAIGLAVVLAVGLAFAAEAVDTRVRLVDEIGRRLGLPLLGRLPAPRRRRRRFASLRGRDGDAATLDPALLMLGDPTGVDAEGYRILRANVDFANAERRAQCIMVTSALQREGKSETVANLAVAFARSGRRVALVDLDLRRPTLHRLFELPGSLGVVDVAAGVLDLDRALVRVPLDRRVHGHLETGNTRRPGVGTLDVLPAGVVLPSDPGEFVGEQALGDVLRDLRLRADLVFVDTPGLLPVGDAMALSKQVDALLVVVRLKAMRRPILKELRRVLDACPSPKLGYVVTDAESELGYGYGYAGADSRERTTEDKRGRLSQPLATAHARQVPE